MGDGVGHEPMQPRPFPFSQNLFKYYPAKIGKFGHGQRRDLPPYSAIKNEVDFIPILGQDRRHMIYNLCHTYLLYMRYSSCCHYCLY